MAISSKSSPNDSATQWSASALVFALSLLAGQLLLPDLINPPSSHGADTPEDMPTVKNVQVPNVFHGHGLARPDPAYAEVDNAPRMVTSANGASSEWNQFTRSCNAGRWKLPDRMMIIILSIFVLLGFAVSRIDVREMSKKHADEAENDILFPKRPFIFVAVMMFTLAGKFIFLSDFGNLFDQITAVAPCADSWVASLMKDDSSDLLQFFWAPANEIWSLPDCLMIVLLIAFAFFGVLASRSDMYEMIEETSEAAEDCFSSPTRLVIFVTLILAVPAFTFSAALKDLRDEIIANALCLGARVASLTQHASALPDNVMIILIIAFVFFGFVVSRIDVYEMSEESTDTPEDGFSCPTRSLIVVSLVVPLVDIVLPFSASIMTMQSVSAMPNVVMIALVTAFVFFGFAVSHSLVLGQVIVLHL